MAAKAPAEAHPIHASHLGAPKSKAESETSTQPTARARWIAIPDPLPNNTWVNTAIGSESFSYFANEVLGFWPEKLLLSFITFWLVGVLLTASGGRTRIVGFVALAIVVCVEAYVYFGLLFLGTNPFIETAAVKLLYLLPFVWLLFESRKRRPKQVL